MELKVTGIEIDKKALEPAVIILVDIEYYQDIEVPVSVVGNLISSEGKIVSRLQEYNHESIDRGSYTLSMLHEKYIDAAYKIGSGSQRIYKAKLTGTLSAMAINHIEERREKDLDKKVIFNFDFFINSMLLPFKAKGASVFDNYGVSVVEVKKESKFSYFQINQGDWTKDFSPTLGLGNFILLEFQIPNKKMVHDKWIQLYDRLFVRAKDMEDALRQGDWTKTMFHARQFYELIKIGDGKPNHKWFEENLKQLFIDAQHSEEGVKHLLNSIYHLFEFTSKYIHDKNHSQELNPIPNSTKEDAYFAFTISISLLNVIGKKISK